MKPLSRETIRVTVAAGTSRGQIAHTLNLAYANGLLSEDTFLHRIDELLDARVIEPGRLVGDLNLRSARGAWVAGATALVSRAVGGLISAGARTPPTLLALDWTGAESEMLVGRHDTCDVVLEDPAVSRRHAQLRFRDGRWILQDLESTNGTTVNGVPVGRCELRPGDRVVMGDARLTID
jgi:hypothetical protein